MYYFFALLLVLPLSPLAHVLPLVDDVSSSTWYHEPDSSVYDLFRRDGQGPPFGSPEWVGLFPAPDYNRSIIASAWKDALDSAVQAGKIPNIPTSTQIKPGTNPVYPPNVNPGGSEICSGTYQCRNPGDIWDPPAGVYGIGFDDGPTPYSQKLADFLQSNGLNTTHFIIGSNIIYYPNEFMKLVNKGHDFAVHTWTHPYLTTLSNMHIASELGWTMYILYMSTGRLPKYWRPPYGDSDNRVRAIAKELFNLTCIMWNHDSEDWSLVTGGTTAAKIHAQMQNWVSGPKNPGLIVLEHETSDASVSAFIDAYPIIMGNGWNFVSVARLGNSSAYQDPASPAGVLMNNPGPVGTSSPIQLASASGHTSTAQYNQLSQSAVPTGQTQQTSGASERQISWSIFGATLLSIWL